MAVSSVGGRDGRSSALTVILPLKWWGRMYLAVWFLILRQRRFRSFAFKNVDRLRFISAIRWSVLPPFAPRWQPWFRTPEQRWQLLFESNFDGDWDEYLDSFATVLGPALQSIILAGVGYPGLTAPSLFKDYARLYDHTPATYVSAYPELTAGDIRQELMARYGPSAKAAIVTEGFGRKSPRWTTMLFQVEGGRRGSVTRAVLELEASHLFVDVGGIHFARTTVVDHPSGSWLLMTFTHDGTFRPILERLVAANAIASGPDVAGGILTPLLECLVGAPVPSAGWWDAERIVQFMLEHRPPASRNFLAYCAYPGYTAALLKVFADDPRRSRGWPSPQTIW